MNLFRLGAPLTLSMVLLYGLGQALSATTPQEFEITIGQSAAMSGTFKPYGDTIRNSIIARFMRTNTHGGIKGKMLRLITLDDQGEPLVTRRNIERLMRQHKIDMFLGNMGRRNTLALKPFLEQHKIALFFPWGGDQRLRDEQITNVVNGLGYLKPQIETIIDYILDDLQIEKIAIFHDDGSFGKENAAFACDALKNRGITPVAIAPYNRHSMNINKAAETLCAADPHLVLCLSTSRPAAKLIDKFTELGQCSTQFVGIDSTYLVKKFVKTDSPFHYGSYVPDPALSNYPIVKEYRHDIQRFCGSQEHPNILGLAYYIHAAIIIDALQTIEGPITKEAVLKKIEGLQNKDIGGFIVNFDRTTRHAYPLGSTILEGRGW